MLVSLAWPNHVHHASTSLWFRRRAGQPWATTPVTESGFVRVSANAAALPTAVTPAEAIGLLHRIRQVAGHHFLADDVPLVVGDRLATDRVATHRQVTDAHLVALARRHGGRLATLDHAVASLAGGDGVVLVPVIRPPVEPAHSAQL